MTEIDTSAEAVERLAAQYSTYGLRDDEAVAAMLRALGAERDALITDNHDLNRQAEIAYAERDRLAAERDALREALREIKETKGGARLDYAELVRAMREGMERAAEIVDGISVNIMNGRHAPGNISRCVVTSGDCAAAIRAAVQEIKP
jgi:predicted  nucleic acid-binding Zn-ribbon protein